MQNVLLKDLIGKKYHNSISKEQEKPLVLIKFKSMTILSKEEMNIV